MRNSVDVSHAIRTGRKRREWRLQFQNPGMVKGWPLTKTRKMEAQCANMHGVPIHSRAIPPL